MSLLIASFLLNLKNILISKFLKNSQGIGKENKLVVITNQKNSSDIYLNLNSMLLFHPLRLILNFVCII